MNRDSFLVGVNAFVIKDNKILLGKRKNSAGEGEWGLPGGHLEHNEGMIQAVARELLEETGLTCDSFTFLNMGHDSSGDKHYVHVSFLAQNIEGEPSLMEPDKCYGWEWLDLDKLPDNIFDSHKRRIKAFLDNQIFIDSKTPQ
ncbi:MAG: NUDIX domain-containing protein [Candidatus Paceibacterota bacterium]|jgi:8-oxo-dGTP diphosphatase